MPASYSRPQIALHWGIFGLFALNYIVSDDMGRALRTFSQGGTPEGITPMIHVWTGIAILVLTVARLALRFTRGVPDLPTGTPSLLDKAGQWTHWLLYALILALTGSGVAAWFGGIREAGDAHELIVNLTLALIILHAAAALFHQYVIKDGLLGRMTRAG
jgi:cytochrome b561